MCQRVRIASTGETSAATVANTISRCRTTARKEVRDDGRVYHLRGSEVDLLERAGRYRVTFTAS